MKNQKDDKYFWILYSETIIKDDPFIERREITKKIETVSDFHPLDWIISTRRSFKEREIILLNWKEITEELYFDYRSCLFND